MRYVTSYDSPDIDGIACIIAYSELLNKTGTPTKGVYFGTLGLEVEFVKKHTDYFPVTLYTELYKPSDSFILVDTADPDALDPSIDPAKVIEIFDHRALVFAEKFPNASKKHIELVGSCATLITEQLRTQNFIPSKETATYLYSAIVSNTINFKSPITTDRDRVAAEFLLPIAELPNNYIEEMFEAKSNISGETLFETLDQDFSVKTLHGKRVGIAQLEISRVSETLKQIQNVIPETLERMREKDKTDYIFLNCIDIIEGYNTILSFDNATRMLLGKVFQIFDFPEMYKTDSIIMRKQLWPKVEKVISEE